MNIILSLRRIFSVTHLIVVIGFCSLYLYQFDDFANDPGVGWHLETGRYILEHSEIPQIDPFLSSPEPRPWVSDQWLSDALLFSLFKQGGWPLLYNFLGALYLATYFVIFLPGVKKLSGSWLGAVIGVFFAFKLSQIHFILRPVVFGFPLFAVTLLSALNWYRTDLKRPPWGLLLVFILWSNLHPSFVLGLIVLGCVLLGRFIDRFLAGSSETLNANEIWRELRPGVIFFLASCLSTMINPYGFELHKSIFSLGQSTFFMNLNEEWLSPNFDELAGTLFLSFLTYLGVCLGLGSRPRWGAGEALLFLVFTQFSLKAVRFFPYSTMVYAPLMAESLVALGAARIFSAYHSFAMVKNACSRIESRQKFSALFTLVIISALFCWGLFNNKVVLYEGDFGPGHKKYPYKALEFLRSVGTLEDPAIVLSSPDWGGFIAHEGKGRVRGVIDDRNTMLGEPFYREYLDSMRSGSNWMTFAEKLGAEYFLLASKSPLKCDIESNGFKIVYSDTQAIVAKLKDRE